MAVSDTAITLVRLVKMEAPNGDVLLSDGGFCDFDGERYESEHNIYGTLTNISALESGFGDQSESNNLVFAPNSDVNQFQWYRDDLEDSRVRVWMGELNEATNEVQDARQLGDYLVDTVGLELSRGATALQLSLIARSEKLFLINEGNVCSTRFHQKQYPGELGFDNCTGVPGYLAWGVAAPQQGSSSGGGGSSPLVPNNNVDLL